MRPLTWSRDLLSATRDLQASPAIFFGSITVRALTTEANAAAGDALSPAERVARYWADNRRGSRPLSWLEHPTIVAYVNRRVSGDPKVGTYQWFKDRYIPRPLDRCLMIGCGHGELDRDLIRIGAARAFDAFDISPGAIEHARAAARAEGFGDEISYVVADMNECLLPARAYDAIFIVSAAHHVLNLEHMFEQCRGALKANDGLLFLDEYLGPNRFQTPPKLVRIINRLLGALPLHLRENFLVGPGHYVERYSPSPLEHFEATDPSEAIRSADIVKTLAVPFHIVEHRRYGGAILHHLLSGIAGNFDPSSAGDVALLRMLAEMEETLEKTGVIGSDFAAIVARPRNTGGPT